MTYGIQGDDAVHKYCCSSVEEVASGSARTHCQQSRVEQEHHPKEQEDTSKGQQSRPYFSVIGHHGWCGGWWWLVLVLLMCPSAGRPSLRCRLQAEGTIHPLFCWEPNDGWNVRCPVVSSRNDHYCRQGDRDSRCAVMYVLRARIRISRWRVFANERTPPVLLSVRPSCKEQTSWGLAG